ncbi:MAG: glycoside hydrolase family 92 protein, partial [Chitinophagaceae bacterium]|nr:glycoside hydrolase family 92 protein [Chitinophagaceae bacterium]
MKKLYFIFLLLLSITSSAQLVKFVNPFIGTGGHGHTFPGATAPFGFCQLSPDTRIDGSWDGCGGYHYSDSVIYGFSHTHLSGTGVSDYGDILLMPVTKEMRLNDYQYKSTFSHKNEKAEAGYYQVFLNNPKVNVELTTSRHCGFHKYTFPNNTETYVVLDLKHRDEVLDSKMEQIDAYTIRGYRFSKAWATNQKIFFEIKFAQEIDNILYEPNDDKSQTANIDISKCQHALIKLKKGFSKPVNPAPYQIVNVKVGISGVDEAGAHNNLEKVIPHWDFEKTKKEVQDEWEKELGKITVNGVEKGVDEKEKKII